MACVIFAAAAAASSTVTAALPELPVIKYAPPPPLTTASYQTTQHSDCLINAQINRNIVQDKMIARLIVLSNLKYIYIPIYTLHTLCIVYLIIRKHTKDHFCGKKCKQKLKSMGQYDSTFEIYVNFKFFFNCFSAA